jgi:hypothetical protein
MSASLMRAAALLGVLAGTAPAACAGAQAGQDGGIASRVAAAPDGEVWMHYRARPGVCGSVNGISTNGGHPRGAIMITDEGRGYSSGDHWECVEGPVWVALVRRGGLVQDLRVRVARSWSAEGRGRVTDLGEVTPADASAYLLGLAERGNDGEVGEKAILPATLGDGVTTWPSLLRIAKKAEAPSRTRRSAVFWLSQQAGDRVTRELSALVSDGDEDQELRKHAVFALSQRPREEAVPELIRIARTHRDPEIRKTAMFWLGQSGDPRALALFQDILEH